MDAIDWARRDAAGTDDLSQKVIEVLISRLRKAEVRLAELRSEIARSRDAEILLMLHRERAWCERTRDDLVSEVWLRQRLEQAPLLYATNLAHARQR